MPNQRVSSQSTGTSYSHPPGASGPRGLLTHPGCRRVVDAAATVVTVATGLPTTAGPRREDGA